MPTRGSTARKPCTCWWSVPTDYEQVGLVESPTPRCWQQGSDRCARLPAVEGTRHRWTRTPIGRGVSPCCILLLSHALATRSLADDALVDANANSPLRSE